MNYFLGVELNGPQVKISAFRKKGQIYELIKLDNFILSDEANEATKELTSWIGRYLPSPDSIKAVLTVSESSLYIKEIEFPEMEPEKLNEAVYWEIPSIAPIPQSDATFDWQVISKGKNGMLTVLVIVTKNSYIQNTISLFRNAQIDVVSIEPSSYAFARVANAPFDTNTLLCLAEEKGTNFVILKNGIPFFTTSSTGHSQREKVSHIKSAADLSNDIVTEGKKILNYWENKEGLKIHQVVVAGDLVYKFIGNSVSLNLFPPIPSYIGTYKKIGSLKTGEYKDDELGSYLVCLGASARHLQKDVLDGINLFPPDEKQRTEEVRAQKKAISKLMTFVYANTVISIMLIVGIIALNLWWYSLAKQYDNLTKTFTARTSNTFMNEVTNINSTIKSVSTLAKNQEETGAKLKAISDLTPQTLKLTSISLVKTKTLDWTIEGLGDRNSILAFYKKLTQNANAKETGMLYSNLEKNDNNDFLITLSW